jgi:hypothetical protein
MASLSEVRARAAAIAAVAAACAASLAVNLPGHLSYDSVLQLAQGRAGVYNEWHPPVMAWLLGLGDSLLRGSAVFVLLDAALLFGALMVLVLVRPRTGWAAPALVLALAASPQWLIYPGIVWKDVLFAGAAAAGFALLAMTDAQWGHRRLRLGLATAAMLLLALAALARQNGLVVLPFAALALAWMAARRAPDRAPDRVRAVLAWGLAPLAGAVILMALASAALHARSDGEPARAYQLAYLQAYDLAGALRRRPDLPLDRLQRSQPALAGLLRGEAAQAYTPWRIDPIAALPRLKTALLGAPAREVTGQWLDLIGRHPVLYLQVRAEDFRWVAASPDPRACLPVFTGVNGPEPEISQLGMVNHERPLDLKLGAYGRGLASTPVLWHGTYAALSAVLLVLLARRRGPGDVAVAAMLGSALAFAASFLVVSVACDYRYLYFLDVAATAAALYLAADPDGLSRTAPRSRATAG